jgi:hypothetical protein
MVCWRVKSFGPECGRKDDEDLGQQRKSVKGKMREGRFLCIESLKTDIQSICLTNAYQWSNVKKGDSLAMR